MIKWAKLINKERGEGWLVNNGKAQFKKNHGIVCLAPPSYTPKRGSNKNEHRILKKQKRVGYIL